MISFFSYLREKARDAVLAGVQDALDQIDPILANRASALTPPSLPANHSTAALPQLGAAESKDVSPPTSPMQPAPTVSSGGLQERLAQATNAIETNNSALTPPKPSSPKRGRGRPGEGSES